MNRAEPISGPSATSGTEGLQWWQRTVVYQIYPLSFQDTNGDGKGDLPGILSRVDYLSWLGVGTIWLSPVYRSPMADFGYDISDYVAIDPVFGTLDDFDRLVQALHERGIRLILDVVPNHTSNQHPWFLESRSSRDARKRDWYVWADPGPDGGPPNNWLSRFGGSAWEWDERTGQYYYHAFLKEQPDLNWRNGEVREAFCDVLRFWMRRGVDGFRVDASAVLAEDSLLRDDPPNPDYGENTPPPERLTRVFTDDRPESLDYISQLRRTADEFPGRVMVGEVQGSTDRIGNFYSNDQPRFHLPLNYALLEAPWTAVGLGAAIDEYLNAIPDDAWPDWVLGGHDKPRIASRIGRAQARVAAMLLLTLPGTPFFYAGDELGLGDVEVPPEAVLDPFERLVPGFGLNRDPERAPMPWDAGPYAGFSTCEPMLPLPEDADSRNVAAQREDATSSLSLYRELLEMRMKEPALFAGRYQPLREQGDVFRFTRSLRGDEIAILLNLGNTPQEAELPGPGQILLSTHLDISQKQVSSPVALRPDEGVIVKLT